MNNNIVLMLLVSLLISCESANHFFVSMNDFSQQVNKTLSEKCNSRVIVNFNGGMMLNGEIKIINANINFFSKDKPSCSIKEVEEEFFNFLKVNNMNIDVNVATTPWKEM